MTPSHAGGRPLWVAHATVAFGLSSAALLTGLAVAFAAGSWHRGQILVTQPVVTIPAGEISFRPGGDFRIDTRVVDAPLRHETVASFAIQRFLVSQAAYAICVANGACRAADAKGRASDVAVTGVSFVDANAYAAWFSSATAQNWRLPTDAEWQRAAAERAPIEVSSQNSNDPAQRWLQSYRFEVAAGDAFDPLVHLNGYFGQNSTGVSDLAGNIWEWTKSCFENTRLAGDGSVLGSSDYCGIRAIEGQHRTFLPDFIRNPKSGGCSVAFPPDFMGFRLVRQPD